MVMVYVPKKGTALSRICLPGSAVVGNRDGNLLTVYFEGNMYGELGKARFADRVRHAYYRMREKYPTVAMAAVTVEDVIAVGTYNPEVGVVELAPGGEKDLASWLDVHKVPQNELRETAERRPEFRLTRRRIY